MNKKKTLRCFSVLLALSMLIAMLPAGAYAADAWDGSVDVSWYNTTDTNFTITTPAQLAGLAQIVNGNRPNGITKDSFKYKTIYLGADIDLGKMKWTPISNIPSNPFSGTFDGKGYIIDGFVVDADNGAWGGLFGYVKGPKKSGVQSNAYIRNLTLRGKVTVHCTNSVATDVGGLCTQASYVEIDNCIVDVKVSVLCNDGCPSHCAGIVGNASNYLKLTKCLNFGDISGSDYVAGLVGYTDSSMAKCYLIIDGCANYGSISGMGYVGGLVGQFASSPNASSTQQSTLINSYNVGMISATGNYVGGLCASLADKNNVKNCFSTGKIIVAEEATNAGLVFGESLNPGGNSSSVISEVYYLSDTNKSAIGSGVELNLTPMDSAEISSVDFVALLNSNALSLGASDDIFKAGLNHPIFVWQPDEVSDVTLGDINKDGTVNASDVSDLIYALATGSVLGFDVADINTDGTINASDVSELVLKILIDE